MNHYNLYLDESAPTGNIKFFCLGGCIIEENIYKKDITNYTNKLKNTIFGDTNVVLHEYEIREAKYESYKVLKDIGKRNTFWKMMRNIFEKNEFYTICAAVYCKEYKRIYDSNYLNNEYFVALQVILENFAYFLEKHDAQGMVYVESRNPKDSEKLKSHYYTIVANGTLFLNKVLLQKRLLNINFLIKEDNVIGLQLADFIPNSSNRFCSGLEQKDPNLFDLIDKKFYDGGIGLKERFGLKKIP